MITRMQNDLVALAKSLEVLIERSQLSKVLIIDWSSGELTASTYMFANHGDAQRVKTLELDFASNRITHDEFAEQFPGVPYILVNASYGQVPALSATKSTACDGGKLLISGLERKLSGLSMELCTGAGSYNPDDDKLVGELLVTVEFSGNGAAREVVSRVGHELLGLPVTPGATAAEVFGTFESYVSKNTPSLRV